MAKRAAQDIKNKTSRSRKTAKRRAAKQEMLKKLALNRHNKRKALGWARSSDFLL